MPFFKSFTRRACLICLVLAALALTAAQAGAAEQTIRIVNAFPPGGPSDILSRAIAQKMQAALGKPVVVINQAGAGGNVGAADVAKAPADGSTILTGIDTTFTVNPHLYARLPFDPVALKPLMIMASSGLLVGVTPSLGVKSLDELVARAKSAPLTFSSGGNGSPGHLAVAILNEAAATHITQVPYKGNSPAVLALVSGEVQGGVLATPGMLPFVRDGRVTALAVTSHQRSALAPTIPTVAEAGMKELELEVLYVAMLPAATPEPVVEVLRKAFADALGQPDVRAAMTRLDLLPDGRAGAEAAARLAAQSARFAHLIQASGMKVD